MRLLDCYAHCVTHDPGPCYVGGGENKSPSCPEGGVRPPKTGT